MYCYVLDCLPTASTATVTLSLVKTSCGGTSNDTVRMSTLVYDSIHGSLNQIDIEFKQTHFCGVKLESKQKF